MDSVIEDIRVRKILDSRGNPTLEVDVVTWNGFGRAAAPSGASTGAREVVAFPEGGVDKIIGEVEDIISSELIGMDAEDLNEIDLVLKEIDGTENLASIGGNTTVAVQYGNSQSSCIILQHAPLQIPRRKHADRNSISPWKHDKWRSTRR